jgi:hypothetical protein
MAIIYSYPLNDNIKPLDELVGTTEKIINGQLKTVTRNFLLQDLAEFFIVDGGLQKTIILTTNDTSGAATLDQITGVLNIPQYSSDGYQNLQQVTDLGATTTNPITITVGEGVVNGITSFSAQGYGIKGESSENFGVYGTSRSLAGVYGFSESEGVRGEGSTGVKGVGTYYGVEANSTDGVGLLAQTSTGIGVTASSENNGTAIYTYSTSGKGIEVYGNGTISIDVNLGNSNKGLVINSGASSTGNPIVVNKNGVDKLVVNQEGELSIVKIPGGNEFEYLMADGSVSTAIPFNPSDYDLDEFTNAGIDPFAHISDIANKENSANKQNSLALDGTGTKFPTVDAVNLGITNSNYWTKTGNNIQNNNTGNTIFGNGVSYVDASGNFYGNYFYPNTIQGGRFINLNAISSSSALIKYNGDYSSTYDNRTLVDKGYVTTALSTKENSLPTVPVDGYVLSSTTAGVRSWIPMTGGGGVGLSVNYYLNGGTNQGTFGGTTYYEFSKTAVIGTGADFNRNTNGYIASFITDVADPSLLLIPAGNWNLEFFFSSTTPGGSPSFYVELYKYNGTTFTLIASSSATPEGITNGTAIDAYFTALSVPETVLTVNDRLAIRVFVNTSSKTITLHTQNGHLCEVITTFTTGLTALNGLQAQVQNFSVGTSGTDFAINSSGSTHTFNLPDASTTSRGVVTINDQQFSGLKNFTDNIIVNTIKIWRGITNSPFNLAIGFDTLTTSTGNQNTVIGHKALSPINTYASSFNTVLGYEAYSNGAANNNTAIGWQSLFSSEANNNSALGYSSGLLLTTGFQNTFIGAFAGGITGQLISAQNSTAIGYNSFTTKNNQVVLGNSSIVETILRGTTLVDGGVTNAVDSLIVGGPTKCTQYKLTALNTAPASATAAGTLGDIRITAGFIYVCTATNTWVRAALATW